MMLKFNNAHPDHRGNVIYINRDHITAVYEQSSGPGGSLATKIYGQTTIIWDVEESLGEVIKMINQ